ncbi:hypothetical protein ACLOJK_033726 [Asimina triloba]
MSSLPPPVARRLEGKVAIITGGASGIGESAARLFASHGAKVVIADVQDELGHAVCDGSGGAITFFHCDVADEDDVRRLVDFAVATHGKLDIMYSNAGVIDYAATSILTVEKSSLLRVLNINLVGAFLCAKHAGRVMAAARRGCILFTGSATAAIACMREHAYVASKRGVVGLAQNVAAELGEYGIRVNCVSPYAVATGLVKGAVGEEGMEGFEKLMSENGNLKWKTLKAEDVARAALFLASDEDAGYVSGLDLVVDGGFSIVNPSVPIAMSRGSSQH